MRLLIYSLLLLYVSFSPCIAVDVFSAIRFVESTDNKNAINRHSGTIGVYQISRDYWEDACRQDRSLRTRGFKACFDPEYAHRVVISYMLRYAPDALADGDAMTIAIIHNGGPRWWKNPHANPAAYWQRVRAAMRQ